MIFWHPEGLAGHGEAAPFRAGQFFRIGLNLSSTDQPISRSLQPQLPPYLTPTYQPTFLLPWINSGTRKLETNFIAQGPPGLCKLTNSNPFYLVLPCLSCRYLYKGSGLSFLLCSCFCLLPQIWYFPCGLALCEMSPSLEKCNKIFQRH